MREYKALKTQSFVDGSYSIVPLRFEDRMNIMQWRNEQLYHLRQQKPLTVEDQDNYFNNVVARLFEQEKPSQILFSFLENEVCIGYGGLVHINWIDKNAEISFIMETAIESKRFDEIWSAYLNLLDKVAFQDLALHKIYTYAFDLRPHLYTVLLKSNFTEEARLKEHSSFENKYYDVLIHSKINKTVNLIVATEEDTDLTYSWAANKEIRKFSINTNQISFEEHKNWFQKKVNSKDCFYFIALLENKKIGSIRFDINEDNIAVISYLIDPEYHGKGLGKIVLNEGCKELLHHKQVSKIRGLVYEENVASYKAFVGLNFNIIAQEGSLVTFEKNIEL